jgi:hypothetical protein
MQIIEDLSEFTIVLGNDPWLLRNQLPTLFNRKSAVYSTSVTDGFVPKISSEVRSILKHLRNFSTGYDYPGSLLNLSEDHNKEKARDAWTCFRAIAEDEELSPLVERCMSTTFSRANVNLFQDIYSDCVAINGMMSVSFVNYDVDGGFDFFPGLDALGDWLVTKEEFQSVANHVSSVYEEDHFYLANPFEHYSFEEMTRMGWHCRGNPYDGPTVDCDGTMRVCGYRPGTRCPGIHITELATPHGKDKWRQAVYEDAMECPGCSWSCPMSYHLRGLREEDKR